MIDPGSEYTNAEDSTRAAVAVVIEHYGTDAAAVVARAFGCKSGYGHHALRDSYALLHRILEETSATVQSLTAAGVPADLVSYLELSLPLAGEPPIQTARRAVANPLSAELTLPMTRYTRNGGPWWPLDPDAKKILLNEDERLTKLRRAQEEQADFNYSFRSAVVESLKAAGVPPAWANQVRDHYQAMANPGEYNHESKVRVQSRRSVRFDGAKHIIECWESGMDPETYKRFVSSTQLSWRQIPKWHLAGVTPDIARVISGIFGHDAANLTKAIELTGDLQRVLGLVRWVKDVHLAARLEPRWRELRSEMGQFYKEEPLDSVSKVKRAWSALVTLEGSQQSAQRFLDLYVMVDDLVDNEALKTLNAQQDVAVTRLDLIASWAHAELAVPRVRLLLRSGVITPEQALSDEISAMSDSMLEMSATLRQS